MRLLYSNSLRDHFQLWQLASSQTHLFAVHAFRFLLFVKCTPLRFACFPLIDTQNAISDLSRLFVNFTLRPARGSEDG